MKQHVGRFFSSVKATRRGKIDRFRRRVWEVTFFAALACGLAFPVVPASAGLYHPKPSACTFGKDGTSGSSFEGLLNRIAFRQSNRSLYVTNHPSGIYGFDASTVCPTPYPLLTGFEPLATPSLTTEPDIEVDNSGLSSEGNIYIANGAQLLGYGPAGNQLTGFPIPKPGENAIGRRSRSTRAGTSGRPTSSARSTSTARPGPTLDKLDLTRSTALEGEEIRSLDFDADGDLYLSSNGGAWKLPAPAYDAALEIDPEPAGAITVDRTSHDLYVAHAKTIDRYDSDGNPIEQFPASPPSGKFTGIAVDEASKAVYAYEREGVNGVDVFKALTLPDLATAPLSGLAKRRRP